MLVRWTKPAVDHLTHIGDYTEEHFGATQARRAAKAIYDTADTLNHMPGAERIGRKPRTREIMVSGCPFVVIYRVAKEALPIIRVLHGAQQWP